MNNAEQPGTKTQVALFVTCLVDMFRPSIGFASIKLLEDANCNVHVPVNQTCCGQSAWNSGELHEKEESAQQIIQTFEHFDYVVAPSGSCAELVQKQYPKLFGDQPQWRERAIKLADKTYELTHFLTEILGISKLSPAIVAQISFHESRSGQRTETTIGQSRKLLEHVEGISIAELDEEQSSVTSAAGSSTDDSSSGNIIRFENPNTKSQTKRQMLLADDLGYLMTKAGQLRKQGSNIEVRHVAEVLADMCDNKPIGRT